MNSTNPNEPTDAADEALDQAFRQRRKQQLAARREPADSASGTSIVAARLAKARAEALTKPLPEVIDLTRGGSASYYER